MVNTEQGGGGARMAMRQAAAHPLLGLRTRMAAANNRPPLPPLQPRRLATPAAPPAQ